MVDSQEMKQTYNQNQQPADGDAAPLYQIPTSELMDLDGDMFALESYQEVLKMESFSSMNDAGQVLLQPPTPTTPLLLDHMNKTPTLEELHDPVFNFNVDLNGETSGKSSWMFSSRLNKVFVKMNQACTFNISYQALNVQELFLRVMMVCSAPEDMHHPVYRCNNHFGGDNAHSDMSDDIKAHVMRCFNPSTRYIGSKTGVAFKDRLAVIVPLGATAQDQASLNVSLEFVCQNSCRIINRRATAIIFTLEDGQGQIFGKKSLHLKVCSCPKRDKQKEEESLTPTKRKSDVQLQAPPGKKVAKVSSVHRHPSQPLAQPRHTTPLPGKLAFIKKEEPPVSPQAQSDRARSLTPLSSQELVDQTATVISIPMPNVQMAVKVAATAFDVVAGELVRCTDDDRRKHLAAYLTQIRRLQSKYEQYL